MLFLDRCLPLSKTPFLDDVTRHLPYPSVVVQVFRRCMGLNTFIDIRYSFATSILHDCVAMGCMKGVVKLIRVSKKSW